MKHSRINYTGAPATFRSSITNYKTQYRVYSVSSSTFIVFYYYSFFPFLAAPENETYLHLKRNSCLRQFGPTFQTSVRLYR